MYTKTDAMIDQANEAIKNLIFISMKEKGKRKGFLGVGPMKQKEYVYQKITNTTDGIYVYVQDQSTSYYVIGFVGYSKKDGIYTAWWMDRYLGEYWEVGDAVIAIILNEFIGMVPSKGTMLKHKNLIYQNDQG